MVRQGVIYTACLTLMLSACSGAAFNQFADNFHKNQQTQQGQINLMMLGGTSYRDAYMAAHNPPHLQRDQEQRALKNELFMIRTQQQQILHDRQEIERKRKAGLVY